MIRNRRKGFTLIELIAVLVILAILALIVTPLVMNIVKKAKDSANKRSVDAYGKAVELAVATYLLDYGEYPEKLDNLKVEYTGNEVLCNIKILNEDGSIYLSECSVSGVEVKDSNTEDEWYHYGKSSNKEVTYQTYNIGDVVTYNGMDFYVIENSNENSDRVTVLKSEPLTVEEVNVYGTGHINMYINPAEAYYQTVYDQNGYGAMAYYTSETCGYTETDFTIDGCTTEYDESEVKYVVDAWSSDKFEEGVLTEDTTGYNARILMYNELLSNLGYEDNIMCTGGCFYNGSFDNVPSWVSSNSYGYWIMNLEFESQNIIHVVGNGVGNIYYSQNVVRPVVTLKKSAI